MVDSLLLVALGVAAFVGFNVGGSNTGVAFGPAVGSQSISKTGAAILMTVFFFLGGWSVGRNVVDTMGKQIVPAELFTIEATIGVLFFIGFALFLSNVVGVPASTSMTGVGSIVGLGLATGTLNWDVMRRIVSWWLVSPVIAFWVSAVIGRYFYSALAERFAIAQTEGSLLILDRSETVPRPSLGPNTTLREVVGTVLVVVIACYTAFSAGSSNTANAIAPLVGNGAVTMNRGILLAGVAAGVGALTIARRTLDTVGNDLTDMPLLAALVVAVVSSTLTTGLSELGVPVSVVVIATMSIVGLGWGRATRVATRTRREHDDTSGVPASVEALAADTDDAPTVGGERVSSDSSTATQTETDAQTTVSRIDDLFDPASSLRVILVQNVVPALATVAAYALFRFVPVVG